MLLPNSKTTPALVLGSLTHAAILEPDDLENQFTIEEMSNGVAYETLKHQYGPE